MLYNESPLAEDYELYCYGPYDDEITLYYDKQKNIMIDEGGFEVPNIFRLISPAMLFLFKHKKEDMVIRGPNGRWIELCYPEEDECYNMF